MSKKQIRIIDPVQIPVKIGKFLGQKINIVLKDNTVFFGQLKKIENNDALFTNLRLKKVKIPLSNILEFYVDIDA